MNLDLYFSYRSPYSYLILPRMLELKEKFDIDINFKVVYPLAIRMPEFFKNKKFPWFAHNCILNRVSKCVITARFW